MTSKYIAVLLATTVTCAAAAPEASSDPGAGPGTTKVKETHPMGARYGFVRASAYPVV